MKDSGNIAAKNASCKFFYNIPLVNVEMLVNGNVKVTIPMPFRNCSEWKRIVTPDGEQKFADPLITNLARAYRWQSLIGREASA